MSYLPKTAIGVTSSVLNGSPADDDYLQWNNEISYYILKNKYNHVLK